MKCPICSNEADYPGEDVNEWFRCVTCNSPLRLSRRVSGWFQLALLGVVAVLFVLASQYPGSVSRGISRLFMLLCISSALLVRIFWKHLPAKLVVHSPELRILNIGGPAPPLSLK